MSFYNTGNPVPSDDPRDLDDNAKIIDVVATSTELSTTDRKGRAIRTLAGLQYDASQGTLRTDLAAPDGSGLVGHDPGGTSASPTTVQAKLRQTISPKDKGAIPDGVTNADSAFTALELDFLHREIDLLGGTYAVSGDFNGCLYFNGFFATPSGLIKKELPSAGSPQVMGGTSEAEAALFFHAASLSGPGGNNIGVQTFALDERTRNIYTLQLNGAGSGNQSTINRFALDGAISQSSLGFSTPVSSDVGHQGLGFERLAGADFRLWTTGFVSSRQAVRYSYADGAPLGNIELYTLFGSEFGSNTSCTPTISYGQEFLVAQGVLTGGVNTTIRVWRLAELVSGGPGDYSDKWVHQWDTQGLVGADHPTQGLASDGKCVWIIAGGNNINIPKRLHMYTMQGGLISADNDFQVGRAQALLDGTGVIYEPEGLVVIRSGTSLALCVGVISGDLGTRFSRVYMLSLNDAIHSGKVLMDGNARSSIVAMTATGRRGVSLLGGTTASNGAAVEVFDSSDSTYPNRIGFSAGGNPATGATLRRTADDITIESIVGEMRLNSPAGAAVRLQSAGASTLATSSAAVTYYQQLLPNINDGPSIGAASRRPSGVFSINGNFSGPVLVGQFTLATLPSASAFNGYLIVVTDATGGAKLCRSNGTVWQLINTTTTVS